MLDELGTGAAAIQLRIFQAPAQFSERTAFPAHGQWSQMPVFVRAGHTTCGVVRPAVASATALCRDALPIVSTLDIHTVRMPVVTLPGKVRLRMAVLTSGMRQHLCHRIECLDRGLRFGRD